MLGHIHYYWVISMKFFLFYFKRLDVYRDRFHRTSRDKMRDWLLITNKVIADLCPLMFHVDYKKCRD